MKLFWALTTLFLAKELQASGNSTWSSAGRLEVGIFPQTYECDKTVAYPCGTSDKSALCTAVHGKNVCYCTAPLYVLDDRTGLCESITKPYIDICSPNPFLCGLDPHARCLVSVKSKKCICSPGFVSIGNQCVLDPIFVVQQTLRKVSVSGAIVAIVLGSAALRWYQTSYCNIEELDGFTSFFPFRNGEFILECEPLFDLSGGNQDREERDDANAASEEDEETDLSDENVIGDESGVIKVVPGPQGWAAVRVTERKSQANEVQARKDESSEYDDPEGVKSKTDGLTYLGKHLLKRAISLLGL